MLFIPSSRKSTDSTKVLRYDESPPDVEISRQVPSQVPTLQQILDRKSLPPVCLYNLYIVMRDRLGNEEVLDFYLDLRHHEVLWRKYIRSLFRVNLIDDSDLTEGVNSLPLAIKIQAIQNSMAEQIRQTNVGNTKHIMPTSTPSDFATQYKDQLQNARYIQESAESILHRYVVQSAHKEISLPSTIRDDITICIQEKLRYDPLVFELAKLWAMNIIQHFSYPEFIHIKSNGNITQGQQVLRICIGLASLFVGFTVELTMLFLGWQMWGVRAWGFFPFWIACWSLITGITALDPLLIIFFNLSETTIFHHNRIQHPYIKKRLHRRAWILLCSITILSTVILSLFCSIPGRRL